MLPLLLACSGVVSHTDGKYDIANGPCVLGRDSREWITLETTTAPAIPEEYQWRLDKRQKFVYSSLCWEASMPKHLDIKIRALLKDNTCS